jgi:hypothetical protein
VADKKRGLADYGISWPTEDQPYPPERPPPAVADSVSFPGMRPMVGASEPVSSTTAHGQMGVAPIYQPQGPSLAEILGHGHTVPKAEIPKERSLHEIAGAGRVIPQYEPPKPGRLSLAEISKNEAGTSAAVEKEKLAGKGHIVVDASGASRLRPGSNVDTSGMREPGADIAIQGKEGAVFAPEARQPFTMASAWGAPAGPARMATTSRSVQLASPDQGEAKEEFGAAKRAGLASVGWEEKAEQGGAARDEQRLKIQSGILKGEEASSHVTQLRHQMENEHAQLAKEEAKRDYESLGKIDPERVWKNKNTFQKVMGVLGVGLMQAGMAINHTGGPNPIMQMLNDQIERDIDAQKSNRYGAKEKYEQAREEGRDLQHAHENEVKDIEEQRARSWRAVGAQLDQIAASPFARNPVIQAHVASLRQQIHQQAGVNDINASQLGERVTEHQSLVGGSAGGPKPVPQDLAVRLPDGRWRIAGDAQTARKAKARIAFNAQIDNNFREGLRTREEIRSALKSANPMRIAQTGAMWDHVRALERANMAASEEATEQGVIRTQEAPEVRRQINLTSIKIGSDDEIHRNMETFRRNGESYVNEMAPHEAAQGRRENGEPVLIYTGEEAPSVLQPGQPGRGIQGIPGYKPAGAR